MTDFYATRSQVARYARRQDIVCFEAIQVTNRGWKLHPMTGDVSEALGFAKDKDYVSHVEARFVDEGRKPGIEQVLIVKCFKDELPTDIPSHFVVLPLTPSLWADGAADNFDHRGSSRAPAGERAKSAAESPTKLVWSIADEMVGADRKDVIAACVAKGVNASTASTQYYRWDKARKS